MSRGKDQIESPSRRSVLKSVAGVGTGLATFGSATSPVAAGDKGDDCNPQGDPARVDTSDHFDTTWYGEVYRTEGNSETNYDLAGAEMPTAPEELVVHIHGWRNDEACGTAGIEATGGAYDANGFTPPVTGLTWDSAYAWWNAKEIASKNAPKLAHFLTEYKSSNPETTVRVQAHSLGVRLLAETLLALHNSGETDVVTSAIFMAGAIDDESVAVSGRYGQAIAEVTTHTENFWMSDDSVLEWAYETYEWSSAVGNEGCDGPSPDNYTDREVLKDIGHSDYYDDEQIIGRVASTFQ